MFGNVHLFAFSCVNHLTYMYNLFLTELDHWQYTLWSIDTVRGFHAMSEKKMQKSIFFLSETCFKDTC